jgi:hypothetical protein
MPSYNTASTATALHVSHKWLDNLLSHNKIAGVSQERQGISRRVSIEAVMVIALTKTLTQTAGLSTQPAVKLAEQLIQSQSGTVHLSPTVSIVVDVQALRHQTLTNLAHAVEVTPHPTRGRPRQS